MPQYMFRVYKIYIKIKWFRTAIRKNDVLL